MVVLSSFLHFVAEETETRDVVTSPCLRSCWPQRHLAATLPLHPAAPRLLRSYWIPHPCSNSARNWGTESLSCRPQSEATSLSMAESGTDACLWFLGWDLPLLRPFLQLPFAVAIPSVLWNLDPVISPRPSRQSMSRSATARGQELALPASGAPSLAPVPYPWDPNAGQTGTPSSLLLPSPRPSPPNSPTLSTCYQFFGLTLGVSPLGSFSNQHLLTGRLASRPSLACAYLSPSWNTSCNSVSQSSVKVGSYGPCSPSVPRTPGCPEVSSTWPSSERARNWPSRPSSGAVRFRHTQLRLAALM